MPKLNREITEPLLCPIDPSFYPEEPTIPKWKLSFISSELYHSKEDNKLREVLEGVLRGVKLHPLTEVKLSSFQPKEWILFAVVWREMLLGEMDKKGVRKYLEMEKDLRRKMLMEKNRLIKKSKKKKL